MFQKFKFRINIGSIIQRFYLYSFGFHFVLFLVEETKKKFKYLRSKSVYLFYELAPVVREMLLFGV